VHRDQTTFHPPIREATPNPSPDLYGAPTAQNKRLLLDIVVHTYNLSTQEAEAGES
jgi:hypothetical protein